MRVWDYVQAIVIIITVIFASYFVTRLVANKGGFFRKSANIKLIASLPLARDKSVAVVEIGEYAYILGVSTQRVERLDKLALSELDLLKEEQVPASEFTANFKKELSDRLKKLHINSKT